MSKIRNGLLAVGLIIMAMFAMATPVEALQDLKITDYNLNTLKGYGTSWYPYGSGDLAMWPGGFNTYGASKTLVYVNSPLGTISAIKIGDGECVAFVKAMSNTNNIASSNWKWGVNVMSATTYIPQGTLIATFRPDGTYDSWGTNGKNHVAVFGGYQYDVFLRRVGIFVWDQNYLPSKGKVVARHLIGLSGIDDVRNANNYYVVRE
jgi:hypothetical protein